MLGKDDQQSIPEPNSTVIGTITRITRQAATISLLTVDGKPCRPDFVGVIRAQDVRQTAKDSVKVSEQLWSSARPSLTLRDHADLVLLSARRRSAGKGRKWCSKASLLAHELTLPFHQISLGDSRSCTLFRR